MGEISEESVVPKSRRRGVAKATTPVVEQRRENQVRLRDREFEILGIHAIKSKRTRAEIIEELIRTHLKRYVVQDRGGPGLASLAGEARVLVETLPMSESATSSEAELSAPPTGEGEGGGGTTALPRRKRA